MKRIIVILAALVLSVGSTALGDTIVTWTFPNNPDDNIADGGITANLSKTITNTATGTTVYNVTGATTYCASNTGWDNGNGTKYWQIEFVTTNYTTLTLSSKQRSSSTGPRDFKLRYKIGAGGTWTDVTGATVTVANDFTTGVLTNVSLPSECNNQASVYLQWIMTSNTSVGAGTVASTGTSRMDDLVVSGTLTSGTPSIFLTSSLSNFGAVVVGNTSTSQNYQVYGTSILDADSIRVTAPTNFQISRDNSTFFDTLNIQAVAGDSVPHTTVYARFAPGGSAYGAQSGNIAHASTGATTVNQAAAGSGVDTEPTTQPTGLSFSDVTGSTMTVNWTRGGTPGDSVIVTCRASSDLSADPADGADYAASGAYGSGSAIGGGCVVYKGTGTSAALSNLSGSTTYYVRCYEYNDGGVPLSANYYTTSPLAGSQATGAGTQPTDHFRTKANGSWGDAGTWESSADSSAWIDATLAPRYTANSIVVQAGDTVTFAASDTVDQLTVAGALTVAASDIKFTLNNGTGTDLAIPSGGTLVNSATGAGNGFIVLSSATWQIQAGGTYVHNTTTGISTPLNTLTMDAAGTIVYRGSTTLVPAVAVSGRTYGNLSFESSSGSWTASVSGTGTLTVNGDFTVGAGVTYATAQTGVMTFGGDFTIDGTFSPGADVQSYAFTGAAAAIAAAGALAFEQCEVNSSGTVSLGSDLTVSGTLTLTAGTLAVGAHTLTLAGPAIAGTPTNLSAGSTSSLVFTGSASGVGTPSNITDLLDLTVDNGNGITVNNSLAIHGTLFLTSGDITMASGTLSYSGGTLHYNGTYDRATTAVEFPAAGGPDNLTVEQHAGETRYTVSLHDDRTIGGTLTLAHGVLGIGDHTLTLNGAIAAASGELSGGPTSNIIMGGAGASTALPSVGVNDLTIDRASGITTSGDITVEGTLTLTSGAFSPGANTTLNILNPIAGTATNYTPDAASNLYIMYSETPPSITIPSSCAALSVLSVDNPNVGLAGDLAISAGGAVFLYSCTVAGNGHQITYDPADTWLHYNGLGTSITTTDVEWPAADGPHNVDIGTESASTILHADRTVAGELALNYGVLETGANTITVTGTSATVGGWVEGNYRKHAAAGSGGSLDFEMGANGGYSPLAVTFGTVTGAGYLTCAAAYDAGGYPSATTPENALTRYWTLTRDAALAFDDCSITLNYLGGDFNTDFEEVNAETLKCGCRYNDGTKAWRWDFFPNTVDTVANTVTVTGVAQTRLGQAGGQANPGADFIIGGSYYKLTGTSWSGVGNDTPAPALPRVLSLSRPYPNPARGRAVIGLGLPEARHVRMEVFNLLGQRIALPADRAYAAGTHQIAWDLRSDQGQRVSDGVYFYRLSAGDRTVTGRLTVLR